MNAENPQSTVTPTFFTVVTYCVACVELILATCGIIGFSFLVEATADMNSLNSATAAALILLVVRLIVAILLLIGNKTKEVCLIWIWMLVGGVTACGLVFLMTIYIQLDIKVVYIPVCIWSVLAIKAMFRIVPKRIGEINRGYEAISNSA